MDEKPTKALARKVRDQLEQALLTLPRQRGGSMEVACQIEEAIDVAIELEFSRHCVMVPSAEIVASHGHRSLLEPLNRDLGVVLGLQLSVGS